jgi:hypothetical protein
MSQNAADRGEATLPLAHPRDAAEAGWLGGMGRRTGFLVRPYLDQLDYSASDLEDHFDRYRRQDGAAELQRGLHRLFDWDHGYCDVYCDVWFSPFP